MFNLILLLCYIGCVALILLIGTMLKPSKKQCVKTSYNEFNDLPQWKPMSTLNKRSNKVLNQMYKGHGSNIEI